MPKNYSQPMLSVVTINYNNASGLERTIKSVITQTEKHHIQYIVIDGKSEDGSKDIIAKYKREIDDVLIESDKGVYDAMNKGLMLCKSKWTIFMNSGDIFAEKDVVSAITKLSETNPRCIAIYGDTLLHDSRLWPTKSLEELWKGMVCSHQSIAISTEYLKSIKFDTNLKIAADYKTILSAYLTGLPFAKLENKPIAQIEAVGISSEFQARTLERWLINKQLASSASYRESINRFYSQLLSNGESNRLSATADSHLGSSYVEKSIIFLISMPRSGSTLLQRIIESSQYIESTGEPWVALPILSSYDEESIESLYDQKVLNSARGALIKELEVNDKLYHDAEISYLHSIYASICNNIEAPFYLDKTPRYSLVVEELYQRLPNAKFIILKRHPLSVINSYCSTWAQNNLKWVANHKSFMNDFRNGFINLIDFAYKHHDSSNVLVIDFEKLTSSPAEIQKTLNKFLGTTVSINNFNSNIFKAREMGDPKTINNVDTILNKKVDPCEDAQKFKNKKYYRNILSAIPAKVFEHYKINVKDFLATIENPSPPGGIESNNNDDIHGISVIITSYNNTSTILAAIASVLNQSRPPEEIIIIDDCSTDDSVKKIKNFMDKSQSSTVIRLIRNPDNKGVSTSRDIAIREAKYRYITTLDGDDTISPLKLKAEFHAIISNDAKVAFSDIKMLTNKGNQILNTRFYHKKDQPQLLTALTNRSYPVPRDMLIEKQLYIAVGGFMKGFNLFEDWMLKQKLTCADGSSGWVHSGVVGTLYDRRNPGLSKNSSIQLLYAQLKVLAINRDLIIQNELDWGAIFIKLLQLDHNSDLINFREIISILNGDPEFSVYVALKMQELGTSLSKMPANNHSDDAIIKALNSFWSAHK